MAAVMLFSNTELLRITADSQELMWDKEHTMDLHNDTSYNEITATHRPVDYTCLEL